MTIGGSGGGRGVRKCLWDKDLKISIKVLALLIREGIICAMKQPANKISIVKNGESYSAIVRQGRKTNSFNFRDKNTARSFVRRNYTQVGTYN
jgi:hypothetical protein